MEPQETIHADYDWIFHGRYFKHYRYPKKISNDEIETYKDGLTEIIPDKLREILDRSNELKVNRDAGLEIISKRTAPESMERLFLSTFIFCEYAEYFVVQKWLKYWLSVWEKIQPQSSRIQHTFEKRNELNLERAKETRIEDIYEGQLRHNGSRFSGLCPFHEEKSPSFFIFPNNHYHCFGCQAHGDVIDFVMKTKSLSFVEAVNSLL